MEVCHLMEKPSLDPWQVCHEGRTGTVLARGLSTNIAQEERSINEQEREPGQIFHTLS